MQLPLPLIRSLLGLAIGLSAVAAAPGAAAQTYPPSIDYLSIFDTRFFESGQLTFGDIDVVFAPPPPANASVSVRKADGTVVGQFGYFPDYVFADKAFARMRVRGPADVKLPGPGNYVIEFAIGGKPVTRFPFALGAAGGGKDPFNTTATFVYDGPWRELGFLAARSFKDTKLVDIVFWIGGPDLPPGKANDRSMAKLLREGKLIAQSKLAQGQIAPGPFKESVHAFFLPHEERQAHAAPALTIEQFMVDGAHEIRIERQSDGAMLRSFRYTIKGGQVQPLARSVLGHSPAIDFIAPRVFAKNTGRYEFREAIWLGASQP